MTQERDREFDKYLEGEDGLSDAYGRLPQDGPPAHLDHAILAEAHRAVRAPRGRSGWRRWSVPLSIAATLVVVVMVGLERPYMPQEGIMPQRVPVTTSAPPPTPGATEGMDKGLAEKKYQAAPSTRQKTMHRRALREGAPAVKNEAAPVPPPSVLRKEKVRSEPQAAAKPVAPPAAGIVQENMRMKAAPAVPAARSVAPRAQMPAASGKPSAREAPPAPAMPAPEQPAQVEDELQAAPRPEATKEQAPASEMAPAAMTAPAAAPALAASAAGKTIDPQQWLMRIRQLRQEGKRAQARKELAAFSKRYPRYVLPKDLRDLRQ